MGFMPEKLSMRDKALLGVTVLALVAGGAGYYFMSKAPVAADEPSAASPAQAASATPTTKEKKPLELQDATPPQTGGGPRVNPDYKGDGK